MTRDEEARLIKAARRGDESAYEQLVLEHQRLVYNLALKITGSPEDALDVSQVVFLKAYLNLSSFREDSRIAVWLYRLTHNACMDHIRHNRPKNVISMTQEEGGGAYDVPDPSPQPQEMAEQQELSRLVWDAIGQLPEDKREVLVMREISGMTYSEIAAALKIQEGTVKSRLSRSRLALAEILKKSGTFSGASQSNNVKGGR